MYDNDEFLERKQNKMDNMEIEKRLQLAKEPIEKQIQNLAINCGFAKLVLVGITLDGGITQSNVSCNLVEALGMLEIGKALTLKNNEVKR